MILGLLTACNNLQGIDQDDLVGLALQKTRFLHVFDDLQELRTHYEREKPESIEEKQLKNKLISHKRLQPIYDSMDQMYSIRFSPPFRSDLLHVAS